MLYILGTLLDVKKYSRGRRNTSYLCLLESMQADSIAGEDILDSVEDYTEFWVQQIDRSGLYHVKDNVFGLFREIELVCRKFLDIRSTPKENVLLQIIDEALSSPDILALWDDLTETCSDNTDTTGLLQEMCNPWSTVHIHSFANGWSDRFQKGFRKGTRKTLQQQNIQK